jgi:hypothetical protein
MKFCSVCGVALAQPTTPTGQPEQNSSGFGYIPPQLPKITKKKSNKFAIGVILLILFVAWLSNGESSETSGSASETSGSTLTPGGSIYEIPEKTVNEIFTETYFPISIELEAKLTEISDYALSGDLQSTVASCYELKDLSERGQALQPTGNLDFDQAWGNAMETGVNASNSCIIEDFDSAANYISEMSGYIASATDAIE